ncbi:unnamed protein product, partial [Rotaria socialis]
MSGVVSSVQDRSIDDEFIENLKSLSVSRSLATYTDGIKELHVQLKRATQNGLRNNISFAFGIVANLY